MKNNCPGLSSTMLNLKGDERIVKRSGFKLTMAIGLVLLFAVALMAGCTKAKEASAPAELNLFIWSEYIPPSVIEKFEKKYNVKVNYSTYASNEEMLAKLMAGNSQYDLSVATDYMVDILRKKKMMQELEMRNIPNFKNIGDEYKNQSFDPGNKFTVPYLGGNVLLAVNTDKVKQPITGYKDLWSPELKNSMVVLDDQRIVIGMALKKLGYSFNETDPKKLEQAKAELQKLAPNIKAYDSDSPKTLLINGEATIGLVWGAEGALARKENSSIKIVFPAEGMNIWQDNIFIPQGAPHKKTAEQFVNFILDPEISAEISKAFPYANPNMAARKLMDQDTLNNGAIYTPKEEAAKGERILDVGEATVIFDRIWTEVKQE